MRPTRRRRRVPGGSPAYRPAAGSAPSPGRGWTTPPAAGAVRGGVQHVKPAAVCSKKVSLRDQVSAGVVKTTHLGGLLEEPVPAPALEGGTRGHQLHAGPRPRHLRGVLQRHHGHVPLRQARVEIWRAMSPMTGGARAAQAKGWAAALALEIAATWHCASLPAPSHSSTRSPSFRRRDLTAGRE